MKLLKNIQKEYQKFKVYDSEGIFEWFLKRKLGFWGKIIFSILLSSLGGYIVTNPVRMIYLIYITIILSVIIIIIEIYDLIKKKIRAI